MPANALQILLCGVIAMVLGAVWYGPVFGKMWLEVIGATKADLEARKKMQQAAGPLYLVQFLLVLFQLYVLTMVGHPLWVWAGFVMPTLAGACMWNNDSRNVAWTRFLLQSGYQLLCFIIFSLILF